MNCRACWRTSASPRGEWRVGKGIRVGMRLNKRGFSLIELLLVVAIIMVIFAIGTPYLLRSTQTAYDASAVAYLRHMQSAQEAYRITNGEYADNFNELTPFITSQLQAAAFWNTPASYGLVPLAVAAPMEPVASEQEDPEEDEEESPPPEQGETPPDGGGPPSPDQVVYSMYIFGLTRTQPDGWECTAEPVRDRTANRYFFTDSSGVIRFAVGSLADASSPPI